VNLFSLIGFDIMTIAPKKQKKIPKIPKEVLYHIYQLLQYSPETGLKTLLSYSPCKTSLYDNLDLIVKICAATDQSRNLFFHNEEQSKLILTTQIESIRYQTSFIELCSWCEIFRFEIQINHVFVALWILAVFKKKGFCWVDDIEKLELSGLSLSYLPSNFTDLSHLTYIDLKSNQLNLEQLCFSNFSELKTLLLDENELSVFPDLTGCSLLQVLDVSSNKINNIPYRIGNHKLLQKLDVSFNQIQSIPNTIGELTALQEFLFCSNRIRYIPEEIVNCSHLEHFCGFKNFIHKLPTNIQRMKHLMVLEMDDNELEYLPAGISQLSHLVKLNVRENFILSLPTDIGNLSELCELDISSNQLVNLPNSLCRLQNLQSLHLSDNPFVSFLCAPYRRHRPSKKADTQAPTPQNIQNVYAQILHILVTFFANYIDIYNDELMIQHDLKEEVFFSLHIQTELLVIRASKKIGTKNLSLSHRKISQIPRSIKNCPHIEFLDLSINNIDSINDDIYGCTNLQYLNLSTNKLKCIHIQSSRMPQLQTLDLSNNKIKRFVMTMKHEQLQDLNVINNKLKHWPPDIFHSCTKLQNIHCANNRLPTVPKKIKQLTQLRTFCAQHNRISNISALIECINLEHIDLEDNQISQIPADLLLLPKLRYLNIKNNCVTSLPNIQSPSLEYLFIQGNHIKSIPMILLQSPFLKIVSLKKHSFTGTTLRITYS
jgi:Leucine-rich repeat (LRR) protein